MAYQAMQLDAAEKRRKRHRLLAQQISYDSDLKKNHRAQEELEYALKEYKREIDRIVARREIAQHDLAKLKNRSVFYERELHRIKKELQEL